MLRLRSCSASRISHFSQDDSDVLSPASRRDLDSRVNKATKCPAPGRAFSFFPEDIVY